MNRRDLIAALALSATTALPAFAQAAAPMRTRWRVVESEGLDAIVFLGPLSGGDLYRRFYAADADALSSRLPAAIATDVAALYADADASEFGLLAPVLANAMSGIDLATIGDVVAALAEPDARIRPSYQASEYWDADDWSWLSANASHLHAVFAAMRDADFAGFRRERIGDLAARIVTVREALAAYDVVPWQEKLTGRRFESTITIILLQFAKPHESKMQGQTFTQSADWNTATTVRVAAHEMLHPPFPMDGAAALAALAVLERDPLIPRIVKDHDPKWGYTTLDGMLDEDMCQALDQFISEGLGVARHPADRWRNADDGIHVLAGGLYGLLRQDRWMEAGGDIEQWLAKAVADGRLAPDVLHPIAAQVLERPVDHLWPLATTT